MSYISRSRLFSKLDRKVEKVTTTSGVTRGKILEYSEVIKYNFIKRGIFVSKFYSILKGIAL